MFIGSPHQLINDGLFRGEIVLDFDIIDGWDKESETMNDGKKGEPYLFPYCNIVIVMTSFCKWS
ncbi:MAG: hypothetical protein WAM14_24460 [Candidatus Nitrosopolaris sp.]